MKYIEVSNLFIQVLLLLKLSQCISADPLPPIKCSLKDSVCLTKQAQATLQTLVNGDPTIGLQKLDEMHVDPLTMQAADMTYDLFDVEVGGLNNTIFDEVSIDMALNIMRIASHTTLTVNTGYKNDGVLYSLPFFGEGIAEFIMKNLQMEIIIVFEIVKNEQGKDIMDLKTHYHGYDPVDGISYQFENMYNGDKKKSDLFHALINKTWRTVVANFGDFFIGKINEEVFKAIKIYMRSRPLEELALY